jgi:membrane fusion protein, multidrug efflux system
VKRHLFNPNKVKMMKMKRPYLFFGAAVCLAAIVLMAFTSRPGQTDAVKTTVRPVAVEVARVTPADIADLVTGVGTVTAMKDVIVSSETAGRVTAVRVKVGDPVRKGQTLIEVDAELKQVAVDQSRAQLQAAETNLEKTRKDFERADKLFKSQDVADVELQGYRLAFSAAEAQQKSAEAALRLAQRQLSDTRITSPISGVVASRRIEVGEMAVPGKEVANVVDISSVKVKLSVAEEDIGKLRLGQKATLRLDAHADEMFDGTVYTIGAKSESPNGHTYAVEILVRNRGANVLKAGMYARVDILASIATNALSVSKESIVETGGKPAVFVVENGVAHLRSITLGIRGAERYQVLDGLSAGELIVSFGQKGIKDGAAVQYENQ